MKSPFFFFVTKIEIKPLQQCHTTADKSEEKVGSKTLFFFFPPVNKPNIGYVFCCCMA